MFVGFFSLIRKITLAVCSRDTNEDGTFVDRESLTVRRRCRFNRSRVLRQAERTHKQTDRSKT